MRCFYRFDFQMCFAPQPRAFFRHLNSQTKSAPVLTSTCALRHSRVAIFINLWSLIRPDGCAPAALASLLFDPPEPQNTGKTQRLATSSFLLLFLFSDFFIFLFFLSLLWLFPRLLLHLSIIFSEVWLQNLLRLSSIIITSHPDVGRKQGKCCSYKWSDEHAAHYAFQAVRTSQMLHTHLPSNVPKLVSHLMSTINMAPWLEMPWICLGFSILLDTHVMSRPPCQVINHARRGCMCPSNTASMVFTTVAAYQRPVVNRQWPLANCKWVRVNIGGDDLTTKHQRHINDTYSHHMPELKETSMCPRVLWELAPIGLSVDLSLVESSTFSNVTQHVAGEEIEFISGTGLRTYREIATRHCEEFWALDVSIKVPHFSVTPLSLNWAHSLVVL